MFPSTIFFPPPPLSANGREAKRAFEKEQIQTVLTVQLASYPPPLLLPLLLVLIVNSLLDPNLVFTLCPR